MTKPAVIKIELTDGNLVIEGEPGSNQQDTEFFEALSAGILLAIKEMAGIELNPVEKVNPDTDNILRFPSNKTVH